jgi:predicted metal-dependent hydrolase
MQLEVTYDKKTIAFTHKIAKRLKNAYITIHQTEGVILKSRQMPVYKAKEIVLKKAPWIIKKLSDIKEVSRIEFVSGSFIPFQGENFEINFIEQINQKNVVIDFSNSKFNIFVNQGMTGNDLESRKNIEDALGEFYKKQSIKKLSSRVEHWSNIMNLFPTGLKFRKLKRRWGSCTYDNQVIFNYNIIQLPELYSDYIIIHELAHIKVKNHSRDFWNLVESYLPECKKIHKAVLNLMP